MAPEHLMKEFRKLHQFMVFSVNTPMQLAIDAYLKKNESYLLLADFYQKKRDYFAQLIKETKFTLLKCEGSYFQNVSYEKISAEADLDFALKLVKNFKVACVPNSAFYTKNTDFKTLRFCFAKKEETLELAAQYLMKL